MSAGSIELSPPSKGRITQRFAQTQLQDGLPHAGQDWEYTDGVDIYDGAYAMADGVVVWSDDTRKLGWPNPWYFNPDFDRTDARDSSAGNAVVLKHWFGYTTYCHLEETPLNDGDSVKRGQRVGTVGATGFSSGKHLHSDLILNGADVSRAPLYGRSDPNPYLTGGLSYQPESITPIQEDELSEQYEKDTRAEWDTLRAFQSDVRQQLSGLPSLDRDVRADLEVKGRQITALTSTVDALAGVIGQEQGLDVEQVKRAVTEAISAGLKITVEAGGQQ